MIYDVLIIGGGPAGLTAAVYASRQGLKTAVITIDIGGQLIMSPKIENFPAVPPISGFELANRILEQAKTLGCEIFYDEAEEIKEDSDGFRVRVKSGKIYESKAIILAIGKKPRKLNVPGEEKLAGRGVSYCAICDAPLYMNKRVAIVGWGETIYEAATMFHKNKNKIYVISPSKIRLQEELPKKLQRLGAEIIEKSKIEEIKGDLTVKSVVLKKLDTGEKTELQVDGVFVEMGYIADTNWIKNLVNVNQNGEIIVDKSCRTSKNGIFAAGDVTDVPYKQAVIAAAQGATAALSAYNYLISLEGGTEIRSDWRKLLK
ncbi:MAG: FAD-dependent oxidoreductase [Thaumarchaeota archaeon]|nr:FAD-dependent oxidoreductase [Nitrososphaerota archaeon]